MPRSTQYQRRLDFIFGVPLILLAAAIRCRRKVPASPARIGLISPSAIGDLILESGVLIRLRERYPGAELHLFHGRTNAGLVPLLPVEVVSHPCEFREFLATLRTIRGSRVELLVDLTPWPRLTALHAALSGAATVGFHSERQFRHYAFDVAVPHQRSRHELDNLKAMTDVLSGEQPYEVRLREDVASGRKREEWNRLILCHVSPGGSRSEWKSWPIEYWVELVRALTKDGFMVGFTGTTADEAHVRKIMSELGPEQRALVSLCGRMSLSELAMVLKSCLLCISVDTGIMHLASALRVPLIGLLGPSSSLRWGARSPNAVNLDSPHPAAGFIHLGFESHPRGSEVMRALTVAAVLDTARAILGRSAVERRAHSAGPQS